MMAAVLLEAGADVNARADDGAPPLHGAVMHGLLEVVEWLLGSGADAAAANTNGATALHEAARSGQVRMIQPLVEFSQ